jgi:hypothetical protein
MSKRAESRTEVSPLDPVFNHHEDGLHSQQKHITTESKPWSIKTLANYDLELLLIVPPICFLIFAGLVAKHKGTPIDQHSVPAPQSAAKYGPTLFTIVFAAIVGSLLKAVAAWKLERGITVVSLDHLLNSRTVFSAVTAPFHLRAFSVLTPILLVLWVLSPLGGQAAFRIIQISPNTASMQRNIGYLEYWSSFHTVVL